MNTLMRGYACTCVPGALYRRCLSHCTRPTAHCARLACIVHGPPPGVMAWLQDLQQCSADSTLGAYTLIQAASFCTAMQLDQSSYSRMECLANTSSISRSCAAAAAVSPVQDRTETAAKPLSVHAAAYAWTAGCLIEQQLHLPPGFTVPANTSVPAYQLVGIFRSMLGHPQLPLAARANSLEAKWALLRLTLLMAAGQQQQLEQELQQLLDDVLLPHAADKLLKVLANPKVPQENKLNAEQRHQQLYQDCVTSITSWVSTACAAPSFELLQPAMAAVSSAMAASLAAGGLQSLPSSNSSGKMMEESALKILQESLPTGWSLLPTLHVLGANGVAFSVQPGCKYEVDMLVLDEQRVAVAMVEVKLGAANPLMALFNDVGALLRLVDAAAGSTLTAITKSNVPDFSAAAAAAVVKAGATGAATSAFSKARAAIQTAPFAEPSAWRTVHVSVHKNVLPIYVLGKGISEADMRKGCRSLIDSSALKLLSKSAAGLQHALLPLQAAAGLTHQEQQHSQQKQPQQQPAQQQQQKQQHAQIVQHQQQESCNTVTGSSQSQGEGTTSGRLHQPAADKLSCKAAADTTPGVIPLIVLQQQQQQQQKLAQALPADVKLSHRSIDPFCSGASSTDDSRSNISTRVQLHLNEQHRAWITAHVQQKLDMLERCKVFCLNVSKGEQ